MSKRKITLTEQQWQAMLNAEQFHITREKGTEPPFSGQYWDFWEHGDYRCIGCGAILFHAEHKFNATCGWPSFSAAAIPENIEQAMDDRHGMQRIEVLCQQCGAHLGHVFNDGPPPTGLRYCINSAALSFFPSTSPK